MANQEVKIKLGVDAGSAEQEVKNLKDQVAGLASAFNAGDISIKDFNKVNRELSTGIRANNTLIKTFGDSMQQSLQTAEVDMTKFGSATRVSLDSLTTFGTQMTGLKEAFNLFSTGVDHALAGFKAGEHLQTTIASFEGLGLSAIEAKNTMTDLGVIAQRTYQPLEGVTESYKHLLTVLGDKAPKEEMLAIIENFAKLGKVSGTSAMSTQLAMTQLNQALATGTLQGGDLRSIAQQMPVVEREIAKAMGTSVGNLKVLASEGKITSDVLIKALGTEATAHIAESFQKLPPTLENVTQKFKNIGEQAKASLAGTAPLAKELNEIADTLGGSTVAKGTLGAMMFGGEALAGMAAAARGLVAISDAMKVLNISMATTAAIAAPVVAGIGALGIAYAQWKGITQQAPEQITKVISAAGSEWRAANDETKKSFATIEEAKKRYEELAAATSKAAQATNEHGKAGKVHLTDAEKAAKKLQEQLQHTADASKKLWESFKDKQDWEALKAEVQISILADEEKNKAEAERVGKQWANTFVIATDELIGERLANGLLDSESLGAMLEAGKITAEQFSKGMEKVYELKDQASNVGKTLADQAKEDSQRFKENWGMGIDEMGDQFASMLRNTNKSFKDSIADMAKSLAISGITRWLTAGLGGGGWTSGIGSIFAPKSALQADESMISQFGQSSGQRYDVVPMMGRASDVTDVLAKAVSQREAPQVIVNNNAPATEVKHETDPNGIVTLTIQRIQADLATGQGGISRQLQSTYGLGRASM